jgi:hypothetical protein
LSPNIRLGWKLPTSSNTLAYYGAELFSRFCPCNEISLRTDKFVQASLMFESRACTSQNGAAYSAPPTVTCKYWTTLKKLAENKHSTVVKYIFKRYTRVTYDSNKKHTVVKFTLVNYKTKKVIKLATDRQQPCRRTWVIVSEFPGNPS